MRKTFVIIGLAFLLLSNTFPIEVDIDLNRGWNIIAIPCSTADSDIEDVLPIIEAYRYDESGRYVSITEFPSIAEGFWVFSLADTVVRLDCSCVDDTIASARLLSSDPGDSCFSLHYEMTESLDSTLDITTEGCVIHVTHLPRFNCCLDSINLSFSSSGDSLVVEEKEYVSVPCRCICTVKVDFDIRVPGDGDYILSIYEEEFDGDTTETVDTVTVEDCD